VKASDKPTGTGIVAPRAPATKAALTEAAVAAWRRAGEKVQALRAVQVSRSGYPNGNTLIDSYALEADLFEAEAARCRLEAEATIALEALELERKDEHAIAMSPSLLRERLGPDFARIAELRAEIGRLEHSIANARRTSHEAYTKASERRAAEGLPGVRASIVSPAIEQAPTLEALLVAYEEASADSKHGLPILQQALVFDMKAESARKLEIDLRIEREQERRDEAEDERVARNAQEHAAKLGALEAERRAAQAKREAETAEQIARQRAEMLDADRKREAAARPVAVVLEATKPTANEIAMLADLSSSAARARI
jgi:colicin import membrane protein